MSFPPPEPKATKADLEALEQRRKQDQDELRLKLLSYSELERRVRELETEAAARDVEFKQVKDISLEAKRKTEEYDRKRLEDRRFYLEANAKHKAVNLVISLLASLLSLALLIKQLVT